MPNCFCLRAQCFLHSRERGCLAGPFTASAVVALLSWYISHWRFYVPGYHVLWNLRSGGEGEGRKLAPTILCLKILFRVLAAAALWLHYNRCLESLGRLTFLAALQPRTSPYPRCLLLYCTFFVNQSRLLHSRIASPLWPPSGASSPSIVKTSRTPRQCWSRSLIFLFLMVEVLQSVAVQI